MFGLRRRSELCTLMEMKPYEIGIKTTRNDFTSWTEREREGKKCIVLS